MKQIISFLAFMILSIHCLHGQTLAMQPVKYGFTTYSTANFTSYRANRKICVAAKTGGIIASAGFAATIAGLVVIIGNLNLLGNGTTNETNINTGVGLAQAGGILALLGGSIGLAGAIHDHAGRNRWGIVAPKKNELGIAYNF